MGQFIKALFATLSIKDTTYNNRLCIKAYDAVYYIECHVLFTVMLNVIMLSVVMLSVMASEGENF